MTALTLQDGEAAHFDEHGKMIRRSRWKDANGKVIPDGHMLVVPMMLSDAARKKTDAEVAAEAVAAKFGNSVAINATHQRPHSGSYSDAQNKAREDRQAAYDARLGRLWQCDNSAAASELTPAMEAAANAQAEKDAAERAASPNAGYDRRISNAWKDTRPDVVVADTSRIAPIMPAPAPAVGDAATLDAARKRYHAKLENGWRS